MSVDDRDPDAEQTEEVAMHPAEAAALKLFEAVRGEFDGDMVVSLRAIAPDSICGEPRLIVLLGHDFPWWLRCDDEAPEQFRQRAAAEALQRPRLPTQFGHMRVLIELPTEPEDARERLERRAGNGAGDAGGR